MMPYSTAPRILYIDNNQTGEGGGELLLMLRHGGHRPYTVATATTPGEALELIASEPFDLLILENRLPEMSGVELCRRIRRNDKQTPILFFSDRTRLSECEVSLAAGATEYLVRPIAAENLIETVARLLSDVHVSKRANQPACCLAK
ncbi:MAG: response regulator [Acidobacteriota bacterium]|nr:response regulator [Acidobacteriota bacterium]